MLVPATAVVACLAVVGVCVGVFLTHYKTGAGAGAAFNAIGSSSSVAALEAERQQLVDMDAATHVLSLVNKPMLATPSQATSGGGGGIVWVAPNPYEAKLIAQQMMPQFGFSVSGEWACLDDIWTRESGWIYDAENTASGAYGIPQALPAWKMSSAGPDYLTNAATQIRWGLGYIKQRYGTPCNAWDFELNNGYY
jgi:hypothetical protein